MPPTAAPRSSPHRRISAMVESLIHAIGRSAKRFVLRRSGSRAARVSLAPYSVFGLVIASDIELAELEPAADGAAADAVVRRGAVVAPEAGQGYSAAGDATLLTIPRVGR